ncbi:MAG TPA: hypothetical protein VNJ07_11475 [Chitinophagales bacterium]|nr:hypothetical protein [Chitinophagales bacterium]
MKTLCIILMLSVVPLVRICSQTPLTDFYTRQFPGGQVALFYDRISQPLADPRNFTVFVIHPETKQTIYETKLDGALPYYYRWGIWYYYTTVNIPEALGERFIIRVLDEGLQQSNEFLVYNNFPTPQPPAAVVTVVK